MVLIFSSWWNILVFQNTMCPWVFPSQILLLLLLLEHVFCYRIITDDVIAKHVFCL